MDNEEQQYQQVAELTGLISKDMENYTAEVAMVALLGLLEALYTGVSKNKDEAAKLVTENNKAMIDHINSYDSKDFGFILADHSKPIISG